MCSWPWVSPQCPHCQGRIQKLRHPGKQLPAAFSHPWVSHPRLGEGAGLGSVALGTGDNRHGDTGTRSCRSQQKPHTFLLRASIFGASPEPRQPARRARSVHHPYVCLYIYPCPLAQPRVVAFVASPGSRCDSHLLPPAVGTKGQAWGSLWLRPVPPGHCMGPRGFLCSLFSTCSAIKETQLWCDSPDSSQER